MKNFPKEIRHASGRVMTLAPDKVLISAKGSPKSASKDIGKLGLEPEALVHPGATTKVGREMREINSSDTRMWMRTSNHSDVSWPKLGSMVKDSKSPVEWVSPVYKLKINDREEFLSLLPGVLLVKLYDKKDTKGFSMLCKRYGLIEDKNKSRYLGDYHYCVLKNIEKASALQLIDKLRDEKDLVEDVRFETMPMVKPVAYVPNDPLYADQWDMEQIRAGGTGQTGWNLERGDADVIICILDEGCDLAHPDLTFTPAPTGINLGTMSGNGSPTGNHGTPCAGIAAASINNNEGVAGVAGGCTILPAAFQNWTDTEVAAGIRYATDEGARVISMSFGWDPWDPAIIDPAIQYAFDNNVVMCVATHNHNDDITYPATNPLVMAVGASDQVDNRKDPSSPDGETWWGSNFGPEISVVAPGVLCPTTDRQVGAGYDPASDYILDFNGTSSATPHVAGLAALLISKQRSLTNVETRAIIESTADKVGVVPYAIDPQNPNGTWNEEMGYGRINVLDALEVVNKRCELDIKRWVLDEKRWFIDEMQKHREFELKVRLDEVKGMVMYENPEFDPRIYEDILVRLERLENRTGGKGQPFIQRDERPHVGQELSRRAKVTSRSTTKKRKSKR